MKLKVKTTCSSNVVLAPGFGKTACRGVILVILILTGLMCWRLVVDNEKLRGYGVFSAY
jgi:hypothetical protein